MEDNGETREDLRLPDGDMGKEIVKKLESGDQFLVKFLVFFFTQSRS